MHSRIAANAVSATKMDRPQRCSAHPTTGETYYTMPNNSIRRLAQNGTQFPSNADNPRACSDIEGASTTQHRNVNGHIVRIKEAGGEPFVTTFQWDVYLFGAESGASPVLINLPGRPMAATLKRFFVGPAGNEITGMCETPNGKVMFTNVQHPGDHTAQADIGDPSKYVSRWPGNGGYGAGGRNARPRSATVMITKNDGGRIGS